MKLSHLTIGLLIAGASMSQAQNDGKQIKSGDKQKGDTRIRIKDKRVAAKDSTKVNKPVIKHYTCGPCGMG